MTSEEVALLARDALLEELYTTPKPGLVDLHSNGAHKDMNVPLFELSTEALTPYFAEMSAAGLSDPEGGRKLFLELRNIGVRTEEAMFRATGGINTHKGAIFTLGLFCGTAGVCLGRNGKVSTGELISVQTEMCSGLLDELENSKGKSLLTNGEKGYKLCGTTGIRGEAADGYPHLTQVALPTMKKAIRQGLEWNRVKLVTFMELLAAAEDSNIIHRAGTGGLCYARSRAREFLKNTDMFSDKAITLLRQMDDDFIDHNISPGGCADLLAAAIFIHRLTGGQDEN